MLKALASWKSQGFCFLERSIELQYKASMKLIGNSINDFDINLPYRKPRSQSQVFYIAKHIEIYSRESDKKL